MNRTWLPFLFALCMGTNSLASAQTRIGGIAIGETPDPTLPIAGACPPIHSCPTTEAGSAFPGGVAWDGTHLWVASYFGSNTIFEVDPVSCAVIHSIPGPSIHIGGLAWDGTALWCMPEQTGTIYRLDPTTGAVLTQIPAPSFGEGDPNGSDIAWDGAFLWHADYGHATIYKLDPTNGNILASFPAPGPVPSGVEYSDGVLIVGDSQLDRIYFIDPTTHAVISSCASPDGHPWGLASEPHGLWNAGSATDLYYLLGQAPTSAKRATWGALKVHYR